ncbi:hypothetical protein lerEdw1_009921 [Lerista edwardsae]|nr:hypothetical protein lerEdw1_009921 [Lerista edwardsae]
MTSSSSSYLNLTFSVIGGLTVLWILLRAAWGLAFRVRIYVLSYVWKGVDLARYGPWAVVTGATAGIGKAFAHELAKRGLNVVLISRSLEKLGQVAAEIEEQHGRSTRIIQMDFTQGSESYAPIRAALQGLEIGILVNNVGMTYHKPMRFLDIPEEVSLDLAKICLTPPACHRQLLVVQTLLHAAGDVAADALFDSAIVNCNMLSMVKMIQIILPQMVARKKGIIINVSSLAGCHPFPLGLMYSASKAFMDFFSRALAVEYHSKGIIVQVFLTEPLSLLPGFIDTSMTHNVTRCLKISPDAYAQQALNTVGLTNRTSGCLAHSIMRLLADALVPTWLLLSPVGSALVSLLQKIIMKQD